jgi:hypothetical protein
MRISESTHSVILVQQDPAALWCRNTKLERYQWNLSMAFMSSSKTRDICNCAKASNWYKKLWYGMSSDASHKISYMRKILLIFTEWNAKSRGIFYSDSYPNKVWNKLKRGRESLRVGSTGLAAEPIPLEDRLTGVTSRQFSYFKMKQLEGLKAHEIEGLVQENSDKSFAVLSDTSTSYTQFSKYVDTHFTVKSS